jgi:hypothetical protein
MPDLITTVEDFGPLWDKMSTSDRAYILYNAGFDQEGATHSWADFSEYPETKSSIFKTWKWLDSDTGD